MIRRAIHASDKNVKGILSAFCLLVLLAAVVRLGIIDRGELQSYRFNQYEGASTPDIGSFNGIDPKGQEEEARINGNNHLLIFVIHHDHASADVQFWNNVVRSVALDRRVPSASMQYWGVCDAGAACNSYQPDATFNILAYADPFEMQIVAEADAKDEALLYGAANALESHIAHTSEPSSEADLLEQNLK